MNVITNIDEPKNAAYVPISLLPDANSSTLLIAPVQDVHTGSRISISALTMS
jgi:hypothetical protein